MVMIQVGELKKMAKRTKMIKKVTNQRIKRRINKKINPRRRYKRRKVMNQMKIRKVKLLL